MWLALVPFAAFALAFLAGAVALWYIAKHTTITQTQTKAGKALHLEAPFGTLDVKPEGKPDPRLAELPVYPGALPEDPATADTRTELYVGHQTLEEVSSTHWTADAEDAVWKFFRRELPDWPCNLVQRSGKELIHPEPDGVRLIRVTRKADRTIIETCIKPVGYPNLFTGRS